MSERLWQEAAFENYRGLAKRSAKIAIERALGKRGGELLQGGDNPAYLAAWYSCRARQTAPRPQPRRPAVGAGTPVGALSR